MLQGLPLSTITAPQIFCPHLSVSENHKTLGPLKLYTALAAAFYQKEVFRSLASSEAAESDFDHEIAFPIKPGISEAGNKKCQNICWK